MCLLFVSFLRTLVIAVPVGAKMILEEGVLPVLERHIDAALFAATRLKLAHAVGMLRTKDVHAKRFACKALDARTADETIQVHELVARLLGQRLYLAVPPFLIHARQRR